MNMHAVQHDVPVLDVDPYSDEFLLNPYPFHEQLREAGPLVWLPKYQVWAMARFEHVKAALGDWETFCSSRGVGLTDFKKEKPWRPPSLLLEVDPPFHDRTRGVMSRILSRPALEALREPFARKAEELVNRLADRGELDGVAEIAKAYPLRVFPDSVGLVPEGRENLLPYGDMAFNAFGPRNERLEKSMADAQKVISWITDQCRREALTDEGFGAKIYAEADAGNITHEEAGLLVRSLLTAGLDTTIFGIGNALLCFARHPEQWQILRENPSLAPQAFEEVLRYASPVQTFLRTTTRDVDIEGQTIPEGSKVLLFLASANRDPRQWENPNDFDIQRKAAGHVGFGHGIHVCVGQMVARLETELLFTALAKRIESIELCGEPQWWLNNTLRGLAALPLRLKAASTETTTEPAAAETTSAEQAPAQSKADPSLLSVSIRGKRLETADICSFELVSTDGAPLPVAEAGAHIDVHTGNGLIRQYSICNLPGESSAYRIGVLKDAKSRGGSTWMHEQLNPGSALQISAPRNLFALSENSSPSLLLAGGIGITPILAMAYELQKRQQPFGMHYCTRSRAHTAFIDEIESSSFADQVNLHHDDGARLDIKALLSQTERDTEIYVCGPEGFLQAVLEGARELGWPEEKLHYEYFAATPTSSDDDQAIELRIASTGQTLTVPANASVLSTLEEAGFDIPKSCEQGVCGSCLTGVIDGEPDHRDHFLTPQERHTNDQFTPCCSRAKGGTLTLDL
ncbi:cytochrome P450/oxidoreductase [Marinobacterium mangrovicola]|uniref:Cytochrome P450 n=1 Tax=Marinobacterium mangrovicola TaxID=1476959 RepID=A0A4V2PE05_9GAMM|nr:cytochrome P450/oxidoreductase [Marinobacterium mangrovicola]TCK07156.1 cytochrome P450 [Marinobacterium mangrovicola]